MTEITGRYDIVILGGGIVGSAVAGLLQQQRPARAIALLDRGSLELMASANSLRIIHGGIRYLQSLDILRSLRSTRAQAELFALFPDLVAPLRCRFILNNHGLATPWIARLGALAYNLLSGPLRAPALPGATVECYPHQLQGASKNLFNALCWADGLINDPVSLIKRLRGEMRNVFEGLQIESVVEDRDRYLITGRQLNNTERFQIATRLVIDCRGSGVDLEPFSDRRISWCLGWNLRLRSKLKLDAALAISTSSKRQFFIVTRQDKNAEMGELILGTGYSACGERPSSREEAIKQVHGDTLQFIQQFRQATGDSIISAQDCYQLADIALLPWDGKSRDRLGAPLPLSSEQLLFSRSAAGGRIAVISTKLTTALPLARRVINLIDRI
jgi:glycerol-3-phosphate dehydrogenase